MTGQPDADDADPLGAPERADSSAESTPAKRSRRQFLAVAGAAVLGAGLAGAGVPLVRHLTASTPPRVAPGAAGSLRVDHVTVIDPRDGTRQDDTSILVRDGRIIAVGPPTSFPDARAAIVIDGAGRFAVPGYNNMHTHAIQAEHAPLMMATMLAEGVTGMRQMVGSTQTLRYRAENRLPLGPHTPRLLTMPGDILTPFNAGSVDDVARVIDEQYDDGADFIKMVLTDRDVFFAAIERAHEKGLRIAGHLPESVLPSEASAAGFDCIEHLGASNGIWVESSARRDALVKGLDTSLPVPEWVTGLPLVEKIFTARSAKTLINPAAFDAPEVAESLREAVSSFDDARARALAAVFVDNGTWHSPTLVRLRTQYLMDDDGYRSDPWLDRMSSTARADYAEVLETFAALPATTRDTYRLVYETVVRITKILHDAGVPMMAGTDGQGKAPGQRMQLEFQELGRAGISPLDILRMATTAPADYLGRPATMGVIAAGADADIVLLGSDPLTDVGHLGTVTAVIRDGRHSTADELTALIDSLTARADAGAEELFPNAHDRRFDCC